jgi:hypothetical protein
VLKKIVDQYGCIFGGSFIPAKVDRHEGIFLRNDNQENKLVIIIGCGGLPVT